MPSAAPGRRSRRAGPWRLCSPEQRVGLILTMGRIPSSSPHLAACALCPGTHVPAGTQLLRTPSASQGSVWEGAGDRARMGLMAGLESRPGAGAG